MTTSTATDVPIAKKKSKKRSKSKTSKNPQKEISEKKITPKVKNVAAKDKTVKKSPSNDGADDSVKKRKRKRVHRGKAGGAWAKGSLKKNENSNENKPKTVNVNKTREKKPEPDVGSDPPPPKKAKKADDSKEKLTEQLMSSRFRYLNEQLYTSSSDDAEKLFSEDGTAFTSYHTGFSQQAAKWPKHPLESIYQYLRKHAPKTSVISDHGCGDAKLAEKLTTDGFKSVHSFDLVALNDRVQVANISKVPLEKGSVDYVVFCLSLMGTNLADYLKEANRILKAETGSLIIAEIRSRIPSMKKFIKALEMLGFSPPQKTVPVGGDMFVLMICTKAGKPRHKRPPGLNLQPCLYKKR